MALSRLNLPNIITVARILACPVLFVLVLSPRISILLLAFGLFLAAALTDLWDGYLARRHGWITDTGKLLDPIADKLLLVATFVPFYLVSQRPDPAVAIPWWGSLPLWVVIVIFGRELAVTLFRSWAARRGRVLSAGPSGKIKAFTQNVFAGSLILWYALVRLAAERRWAGSEVWRLWSGFHRAITGLTLAVALFLTVYSMAGYYWESRSLLHGGSQARK
ncbi:MAG: CDP-diacylglycerol--glycerol-3-phosphate 3-phosphatidyltransferase [Gemmatimonadetes bacterium]|nr:CDP-diacylglycerol--glycerol-3-phosphate 3-phosphatidyltransferase [Gemmatimonadota bacterium]